ncbi:MAG TPA: HRDC domain-containing protein [Anaerolineaceae bacterium]|nr:HRDC domain-containing protein [Anaerolineaceae bacterium]
MSEPKLKDPVWVARPPALQRTVQELAQTDCIAVDTESNSLFAYREQVCLIQFSNAEDDYLIDPLAIADLTALDRLFADPRIEKVFHAAEYDLICLKRDYGFTFQNLFDTMVASRVLGRAGVGLGSLLKEEFGIELDKRYQRANWGQRPLPAAQLAYARLDTHFLIPLRDRLKDALVAAGRWELAQEDFIRLEKTAPPDGEHVNGTCWKIAGNAELNARQMAVLHALCDYRDRQAQITNLPLFKVLSNEVLVQTAQALPKTMAELQEKTRLSPRQLERHGAGLLKAVEQGLQAEAPRRPIHHRPDELYLARLDTLRNWRKNTGRELGVESDVVLPRDTMEIIAQANPKSRTDLEQLMSDLPWRLERFGAEILRVLNP